MSPLNDKQDMAETKPVRPGEEIDATRLGAFLSKELDLSSEEIEVMQFPAGSSNLTYLVRLGDAEYVLRRPPFGNTVKSAHDMQREFDVLSKLSAVYAPAPKPLLMSWDASIIGSEFYLMERREGLGQLAADLAFSPEAIVLPNVRCWPMTANRCWHLAIWPCQQVATLTPSAPG